MGCVVIGVTPSSVNNEPDMAKSFGAVNHSKAPEYSVLDCWGAGRTAALALQSRRPMWMAQDSNEAPDDPAMSMGSALNIKSGLWLPFPIPSNPAGVLLLTASEELPRDIDSLGDSLELLDHL